MPDYHRSKSAGGTFFFTVVTYQRRPVFTNKNARDLLRSAWLNVMERYPFTLDAICLLPDHLHCSWTLPAEDDNYSLRWGEIKKCFTKQYLRQTGYGPLRNESRIKRGEAALWQRRFWEHNIRDEDDLNRHLDYIHFNPVKHNLVQNVRDWPWSSFHRHVRLGYYDKDWGSDVGKSIDGLICGE